MFFKKKMIAIHKLLQGTKSALSNVVHDEFIISLHNDDVGMVPYIVAEIEDSNTFRVPIFANATISETNWAEKHSL
jgi:DNA polymerase I-like protein with 3'-5' exonuclease and polymerase domains